MRGLREVWAFVGLLSSKSATTLTSEQASGSNLTLAYSPPFYPSPWMTGTGEWSDAYAKAKDFVSQLTLLEKVNLTTGTYIRSCYCHPNFSFLPANALDTTF
jgi:beta-glucosidase